MPAKHSLAESLASLSATDRAAILSSLSEADARSLLYDWPFWARPAQLPPPGDWLVWLILTGRGWGKTRTGAEWVRSLVERGQASRIALVARIAGDVRDVVIEGESGLLAISPPWNRPTWEPSKRRLTWPNGAVATTYSADEPDLLRGPQHDAAWADEAASWQYAEAWDNLLFGLRLGERPRVTVTTTPKPRPLVRSLLEQHRENPGRVALTTGTTYENLPNLAPAFKEQVLRRYEGTTLGRQEIEGLLIEDVEGALWTRGVIEAGRVRQAPDLRRIVVAIDPSVTATEESNEAGIVVAGLGTDGHGYVLEDLSGRMSPDRWARRAVVAYHARHADRVVAEVNNGGDLVEHTVRTVDENVSYRAVHAARGKHTRAEPVAALYEQGRVHHVGAFPELEDQQCTWVPGEASPDRLDALVWAMTELLVGHVPVRVWRPS